LTTEDIPLSYSAYWIAEWIQRNCSNTIYKIDMWEASTFDYINENGLAFYARFIGLNGN
jgi:hypothetical protein